MTVAKCTGGEPGRTNSSSTSTTSRENLSGRLKMRQLLGWTRTNTPSKGEQSNASPEQQQRQSSIRDLKAMGSSSSAKGIRPRSNTGNNSSEATSKRSASSSSVAETPLPTVTYRKGEKSFLDFHQHYAIVRHLGEGSYSTVKQVTHRKKGGFYACKIVDKQSLSAVDRMALGHEVRVLSSVAHDNIMRLHEVIEDDAKCYLVMELAENGDLFDRIVKTGKFPEREAQKVVAALVEALHYCHGKSIIHRDVKPENVLLSGYNVKLCDFGFAKQLSSPDEQSMDSCGTPGYAAPEILDGKAYGIEVDIFSLGVVTYIMLCGYPPFPMKLSQLRTHRFHVRFPSKDWGHVDPELKDLIAKMLSVHPDRRPSAAKLREHPWIKSGREYLEQLHREAKERKRLAEITRKHQMADSIRQKLIMGGFEVIKYGGNGLPHRTKLRLSTDGKSLTWQPKLFKRGLLRYQNALGFANLFGTHKENSSNSNSQPQLHVHPQINRLTVCEPEAQSRSSEPSVTDDFEETSSVRTSSSTSSTSEAINEKKLWWRSFRRDRGKTERTASGGFSLSFTSRSSSSSFATQQQESSGDARTTVANETGFSSPKRSNDSINLYDIRTMLVGEKSEFFTGHQTNQPNACKRAVDLTCVLTVVTRFRDLHLEFTNQEVRDGFEYLLNQVRLPLEQSPNCATQKQQLQPHRRRNTDASQVEDDEATTEVEEICTTECEETENTNNQCE